MALLLDDALSQAVRVGTAPATAAPLTMACWFRSDDATITQALMSLGDTSANNWFELEAAGSIGGDPVRQMTRNAGTTVNNDTSTGYSANTWHHACGVWVTSSSRLVYIDGGSIGTSSTAVTPASIDALGIGRREIGAPGVYTSGMIAEAAIWDVDLSGSEVAALAKGILPTLIRPQSMVFYNPLIRTLTADLVGGLTLTEVNAPTVGNHPRVYRPRSVRGRRFTTEAGGGPVTGPVYVLVTGSNYATISLTGSNYATQAVSGRNDGTIALTGRYSNTGAAVAIETNIPRGRLFVGEDKVFQYTIYQSDGVTPQDITGWTLSWTLAASSSGAALITVAGVITNAAGGVLTVTVPDTPSGTDALSDGMYWHELKRTDAGSETVLAWGTIPVVDLTA